MLWIFLLIVGLIGSLIIPNALYAYRHYMTQKDKLWFLTYTTFLCMLGFFLFRLTFTAVHFIQVSQDTVAGPDIQ